MFVAHSIPEEIVSLSDYLPKFSELSPTNEQSEGSTSPSEGSSGLQDMYSSDWCNPTLYTPGKDGSASTAPVNTLPADQGDAGQKNARAPAQSTSNRRSAAPIAPSNETGRAAE